MKKMILLMLLFIAVMGYSQAAEVISVNFTHIGSDAAGGGWGFHDTLGRSPLSVAGYSVAGNWNEVWQGTNLTVVSGLIDSNGNTTGAELTLNNDASEGRTNNINSAPGAVHELNKNAVRIANSNIRHDAASAEKTLLTVSGIPYGEYTLIVYLSNKYGGRTAKITVGSTSYYYTNERSVELEQRFFDGSEPWLVASNETVDDYSEIANVAVFAGLTDPTCVITFDAVSANAGVSGIQIVEKDAADWPDPYRDEDAVAVDKEFSWKAPVSFDPLGYKIYMDPNDILVAAGDASALVSTQPGTTLPALDLLYGETYFWRVDSTDPNVGGTPFDIASNVWSFTTEVHPSTLEPQLYAPGIYIGNPSFEKESRWWVATPDWFDNGNAYQLGGITTPYGTVTGVVEGGMHWQAIGTWQPNVDYVISWGVNQEAGRGNSGTKASLWSVAPGSVPPDQTAGDATTPTAIGATMIAETAVYKSEIDNHNVDVSEIINTGISGTDGNAGDALIIKFANGPGGGRGNFDMVRVNLPRDDRSVWGPTPDNGTTGIDPLADLTLSWNQGVDPATNYEPLPTVTRYHIYLGTDADAVGLADTLSTGIFRGYKPVGDESALIPGPFADGTIYHWRVDEELAGGEIITGPVWSLSTLLLDRLIAHWKFQDNLDDTVDFMTGSPTGDWPGAMTSPAYEAGIDGQAIRFVRGDGNYVTIPGSEDFFNFYSEGLTVNMWYKADDYTGLGGYMGLMSKTGGQASDGWKMFDEAFFATQGAQLYIDSLHPSRGGPMDDGQWYMLTITYDETTQTMTAYENGEVYGTAVGAVSSGTAVKVTIGALTDGGAWELRGLIDEVKIYSYALNPMEVAVEYTNLMDGETICPYPNDPSLQYDFNGNCIVDLADLAYIAENWAVCNIVPTCLP